MTNINKKFYGFQYGSGRDTTTGRPNESTKRFSIYGDLAVFSTEEKRNCWITQDDLLPRCMLTAKEARQHCLGLSIDDYNDLVEDSLVESEDEDFLSGHHHQVAYQIRKV